MIDLVSSEQVGRLKDPDVWKPFLIVLFTFSLQIWTGASSIGAQTFHIHLLHLSIIHLQNLSFEPYQFIKTLVTFLCF
jgi:hypothetical protein